MVVVHKCPGIASFNSHLGGPGIKKKIANKMKKKIYNERKIVVKGVFLKEHFSSTAI